MRNVGARPSFECPITSTRLCRRSWRKLFGDTSTAPNLPHTFRVSRQIKGWRRGCCEVDAAKRGRGATLPGKSYSKSRPENRYFPLLPGSPPNFSGRRSILLKIWMWIGKFSCWYSPWSPGGQSAKSNNDVQTRTSDSANLLRCRLIRPPLIQLFALYTLSAGKWREFYNSILWKSLQYNKILIKYKTQLFFKLAFLVLYYLILIIWYDKNWVF